MTIDDATKRISEAASMLGYGFCEFKALEPDLREILYSIGDELDSDAVDKLILEML